MSATDITCDTRFLSQVSNMTEKMCVNNCEKTEEENTPHVAGIYIKENPSFETFEGSDGRRC